MTMLAPSSQAPGATVPSMRLRAERGRGTPDARERLPHRASAGNSAGVREALEVEEVRGRTRGPCGALAAGSGAFGAERRATPRTRSG